MEKEPTLKIDEFGTKRWWLNGYLHREDGPAVEVINVGKGWWLDGEQYSFEKWKVEVRKYYDTNEDYLFMLLKL